MTDIRAKVFKAFKSEYNRHLNAIASFLSDAKAGFEKLPDDYEPVIRAAHTLKGAARAVSLSFVERSGGCLESFFKKAKSGGIVLDAMAIQRLKEMIESLETFIQSADVAYTPPEPPGILYSLEDLLGTGNDSRSTVIRTADSEPVPEQKTTSGAQKTVHRKVFEIFQVEYKEHLEKIRTVLGRFSGTGKLPGDQLLDMLRSAHSLKGASRAVGLDVVQSLAHLLEALWIPLKDGHEHFAPPILAMSNQILNAIEDYVIALDHTGSPPIPVDVMENIRAYLHLSGDGEVLAVNILPDAQEEPARTGKDGPHIVGERIRDTESLDSVRINAQFLDRLQKTSGQLMEETVRQRLILDQIYQLQASVNEMNRDSDYLLRHSGKMIRNFEFQPELAGIARHLFFIQHQTRSLSKGIRNLILQEKAAFRANESFGRRIHADVQNVRMVPAESMFQGFRKMVRDLAMEENKQVDFQIRGLDIPVDRMMLQYLKDPVLHVLRNAISHGIESPEDRKSCGKNENAILRMSLERMDGRLKITVSDDGRGLDYDHITGAAIEQQIITSEDADNFSVSERQSLIFQPGFSTAKTVTELSGRGMGLSVVREMVDKLQGTIRISSSLGTGFSISIITPVTIATHRLLLVRCQHQVFGVPLHYVEKASRIRRNDIQSLEGQPVVEFNRKPVRLASLSRVLFGTESIALSAEDSLPVLFLKSAEQKAAVLVDHLTGEDSFIIKELPKPLRNNRFFSGGFLLKDGIIGLIINPKPFMETAPSADTVAPSGETAVEAIRDAEIHPFRILVVDDSITTRTLEKAILEAHGYHVIVAVDGVDGLKQLRSSEVDLVITDVDMPRMDGIALVREMKQNARLKNLPVIIVSSMDNPRDKERGLEVGADAYIFKQKFDQQNLLEIIRQIL